LKSGRYQQFSDQADGQSKRDKSYKDVLLQMNQQELNGAYKTLEKHLNEANAYAKTWKSYQALWDIESTKVYDVLTDNIDRWN